MAEENDLSIPESDQEKDLKIYSKQAIWGFSVVFAPIFGGVLLRQNLIESQRKKEGNIILLISIGFTLLSILILNSFEHSNSSMTYLLNIGFGAILAEYFFKKYYPDNNYEYKKIWKALLISIAIIIPFILALIYTLEE